MSKAKLNEYSQIKITTTFSYPQLRFYYLIFLHSIYVMLPDPEQHAHHKLSCLFTLEVLQELKEAGKQIPIVLAGTENYEEYTAFSGYESITRVISEETILDKYNFSPFVSNSCMFSQWELCCNFFLSSGQGSYCKLYEIWIAGLSI